MEAETLLQCYLRELVPQVVPRRVTIHVCHQIILQQRERKKDLDLDFIASSFNKKCVVIKEYEKKTLLADTTKCAKKTELHNKSVISKVC